MESTQRTLEQVRHRSDLREPGMNVQATTLHPITSKAVIEIDSNGGPTLVVRRRQGQSLLW